MTSGVPPVSAGRRPSSVRRSRDERWPRSPWPRHRRRRTRPRSPDARRARRRRDVGRRVDSARRCSNASKSGERNRLIEHLAVQLDQERVAAPGRDRRVELAIEPPERRGCRGRPRSGRGSRRRHRGRPSSARSAASAKIGTSSTRRVSNSSRTKCLALDRPSTDTSGRCSATQVRLPAPLDHAERQQSLDRLAHRRARHLELVAQLPLGRDAGTGCQLTGGDALQQLLADLRADGASRHRFERDLLGQARAPDDDDRCSGGTTGSGRWSDQWPMTTIRSRPRWSDHRTVR